jgi:hypothetical protein
MLKPSFAGAVRFRIEIVREQIYQFGDSFRRELPWTARAFFYL